MHGKCNAQGGPGVARIGVVSASSVNTTEGDRVVNNFLRLYKVKSAVEIVVTEEGANDPFVANQIKEQTGIFIVEDSDTGRPFNFLNWITAWMRPSTSSNEEPPIGVVCYEGPSHKRQNLVDTLRPAGVDSLVLTAIKSVISRGGMVAGNAAIMVSLSYLIFKNSNVNNCISI